MIVPESLIREAPDAPSLSLAVGLMSGTSIDGVDAALIRTDGQSRVQPIGFITLPYPPDFRERVRALFGGRDPHAPDVAAVARTLTDHHLAAILALLAQTGFQASDIDVIGFHGQTITHAPHDRFTLQIGDPQHLANTLGQSVVFDLRVDDVAAGGQGAPLIPVYHQALIRQAAVSLPMALLNLGGVGNITFIGRNDDDLVAFDTGPGNALIDDAVLKRTGQPFDRNGALAARGHINRGLLNEWMGHPYFSQKPPKSLDRDAFMVAAVQALETADAIATLTAFTVESVAQAIDFLPEKPTRLLVTGGGRHNATIMQKLAERLSMPVETVDHYRFNGDAMEAEGFAYMAVRRMQNLPISFPGTTGAPHPMTGGKIYRPA